MHSFAAIALLGSLCTVASVAVAGSREHAAMPAYDWPHVYVPLDKGPLRVRFHEDPALKGPAAMVLSSSGLVAGGKVLCAWTGEEQPSYRMLKNCPDDVPVVSGYGDRGIGTPVLYLEFRARKESLFTAKWGARTLYFGARDLPAGWRVEAAKSEGDDAARAKAAPLLSSNAFKAWVGAVAPCLAMDDEAARRTCLAPLASSEADIAETSLRDTFGQCVRLKVPLSVEKTKVTLKAEDGGSCKLELVDGSWKVTAVLQGEGC